MNPARNFLTEIAVAWALEPATLEIIGATALALNVDFQRGTKDADVLKAHGLTDAAQAHLIALAGPGTALARRWRMHVELVPNGIPFLPRPVDWREITLVGAPPTLRVRALGVVDVVVSKLKRFSANDQSDIAEMIRAGHVEHAALVARFLSAVDGFLGDAREQDLPRYVRNLREVERDILGVEESEIDLPDWIG